MDPSINPNESSYYDITNKNQNDPFKINRQKGNFFRCVFSTISIIILIILCIKLLKNSNKLKSAEKKLNSNIEEFNLIENEILNYKNKSEFAEKYRKILDEINDEIDKKENEFRKIRIEFNDDKNFIEKTNETNKKLEEEIENIKNEIKKSDDEIVKLKIEKEKIENEIKEIN